MRGLRNLTTRYGHVGKILSRFCDFLLTACAHRLILRIQIRGTWKRQADRVGDTPWSVKTYALSRDHRKKRAPQESPRSFQVVRGDGCSAE
jgi:hypothetical protein